MLKKKKEIKNLFFIFLPKEQVDQLMDFFEIQQTNKTCFFEMVHLEILKHIQTF